MEGKNNMITDINQATYMSITKLAHAMRYRILKNTGIQLTLMMEIKDKDGVWQPKRIVYDFTRGTARRVQKGEVILS
jgi:hypothetical protein